MNCPLCNGDASERLDEFHVCKSCREILESSELVTKATPETWAAYLVSGATDTTPEEAPLSRLVGA